MGDYVISHEDPANLSTSVIISVFGDFKGGVSTVEKDHLSATQGDVIVLRGYFFLIFSLTQMIVNFFFKLIWLMDISQIFCALFYF